MRYIIYFVALIAVVASASNVTISGGGSGGGTTLSMGSLDGTTAAATGAVISGSSLYMQSASVTVPGLVNTTAQVFAGAKRFQDNLYVGSAPGASWPLSVDATTVLSSSSYQVGNVIGRRTVSASDTETTLGHAGITYLTVNAGQSAHGQVAGLFGETKTPGAGTTDLATGVRAVVSNNGSGGVTDAASLFAGTITNSGGGSITNTYGLFIRDSTVGTTNYPIYSQGTKESYFTGGGSLAAGKFFVSNNGDLNKIDNVYYNWPSSQGSSSTVLTNDGSGNLSWATSSGGVTGSGTDTYLAKFTGSGSIGNTFTTEDSAGITTKTNGNQGTTGTYYQENITFNNTYRGVRNVTGSYSAASSDNYLVSENINLALSGTNSVSNLQSTGSYLNMNGGTYSGGAVQLKGQLVYLTHANQVTDNIAGYNQTYGSHGFEAKVNGGSSGSAIGGFFHAYSTKNAVGVEGLAGPGVTSGRNFGGRFMASQENSSQAIGLHAGIATTASNTMESYDPGISTALSVDNGNTTSNIATMFDNGGSVFQVQDGGSTVIGAHAGTATHVINGNVKFYGQAASIQDTESQAASSAHTIDWNGGNSTEWDLQAATGNVTLTLSNPIKGASYIIKIIQSSTARTVTWPSNVKWPGGTAPTLTTTNDAVDMITLYYDGTNYLSSFALDVK